MSMINLLLKEASLKLRKGREIKYSWFTTFKEDKNNFKIQRISLGLKADSSGLEEAKKKLQLKNLKI